MKPIYLIFFLISSNLVLAEIDLSIESNLDEELYTNVEYDSLFRIKNLNYSISKAQNILINYGIYYNETLIKNDSFFIDEINQWKTAGTGSIIFQEPGDYSIKGEIVSSFPEDYNKENNLCSKNITVISTIDQECDILLDLDIKTNSTFYNESESIEFKHILNNDSIPCIIEYWIEDLFDKDYKARYNSTNTNKKSWKTSIDEKDKILILKSVVYPNCNDTNLSNNYAESMFFVLSNQDEIEESKLATEKNSKITINKIDSDIKFGQPFEVDADIYKGDTRKYSIQAYVKDNTKKISQITKLSIKEKYSSYDGKISILLNPNCNLDFQGKKYDLVIEGLDELEQEKIEISGITEELCVKKSDSSSKEKTSSAKEPTETQVKIKNNQDYQIISRLYCSKELDSNQLIYLSKNEKNKKIVPYLMALVFTLLIASILIKK